MDLKTCAVCGNDIALVATQCNFCGSLQPAGACLPARKRNPVSTVNIKAGLPVVEEGIARLEAELMRARHARVRLLRVIHGWGSGGSEGKLKKACRELLNDMWKSGQIKKIVTGEDYSKSSAPGKELIRRYPALKDSENSDRGNRGITFVEL